MRPRWVYVWAFPTSLPGLLVACCSPHRRVVDGVLEIHGGLATWICRHAFLDGGASAVTIGHVVLGRDAPSLERTRPHEHVHVRQVERWGPFFLPAYGLCSLVLKLRRRDAYRENPFEVEAYAEDARRAEWGD